MNDKLNHTHTQNFLFSAQVAHLEGICNLHLILKTML